MPGIYLQLVRKTGEDGKVAKLPGGRFVFGRSASCDVRLRSSVASRKHAVVELVGGVWEIRDLGSRNGLFVNKTRVEKTELRPLDTVQLGAKGPRLRILSLEPAPTMSGDADDSTRMFQAPGTADAGWPPPRRKEPAYGGEDETEEELEAIPIVLPEEPESEPAPARRARGKSRAPAPRDMEATTAEVARGGGGRGWLVLLLFLVGAGFGAATAFELWPSWWFPYHYVNAPVQLARQTLFPLLGDFGIRYDPHLSAGLAILWFGAFFCWFAHPKRWFFWIFLFAGLQGASLLFLDGTLR